MLWPQSSDWLLDLWNAACLFDSTIVFLLQTCPFSCLLLLGNQNIMTSTYWNASQDNTWSVIALFQLLDLCGADIASIKSGHDRVCLLSLPCHVRRYRSCRILITFYVVSPVFCLMSLLSSTRNFLCAQLGQIKERHYNV